MKILSLKSRYSRLRPVLLLITSLTAAVASAEIWTLERCVDYAVVHNIDIRLRNLQIEQGELSLTEAKDRFLPQVDASASQSFNLGRGLTVENTYANRNTTNTQWGLNLSLPLFQGLAEYRRVDVAKLSLRQYVLQSEVAKDNVTLNVISQYLQVLYCREVEASARSQAEYSAFEVERQKALIDAGKVAEATIYDMEAVAARDRLQVVTSENDTRTALVNLANLLQIELTPDFEVAPLTDPDPIIPTVNDVFDSALGINNSMQSARQAVKVADGNISLAKTGYIPTLSFSAGTGSSFYTVNGTPHDNFGEQMRHNLSTYFGFSLRIPIFDGFTTRNSVRRAQSQKKEAELQLEQSSTNLYKDIRLAYYQATGARERYMTSVETLEKTRRSFEATREKFNLGRATQADYEQAKNNLFQTEVSGIQAHYEYLIRTRILDFYRTGRTQ